MHTHRLASFNILLAPPEEMVDVMRNVGTRITALRAGRWLGAGYWLCGGAGGGGISCWARWAVALRRERTFFVGAIGDIYVNIFPKIRGRLDGDWILPSRPSDIGSGGGDTTISASALGSYIACDLRLNSGNIVGIWTRDTRRHD